MKRYVHIFYCGLLFSFYLLGAQPRSLQLPDLQLHHSIYESLVELEADASQPDTQLEIVKFTDRDFSMIQSTHEAVLVAEAEIAKSALLTRYRHRIRAFYRVEDGALEWFNPEVMLPVTLIKILTRFSGPLLVSAAKLQSLYGPIEKLYGQYADSSHSHDVVTVLLEYNPQTPLVMVEGLTDLEKLFGRNRLCSPPYSNADMKELNHIAKNVASGLKNVLLNNSIRYVNLSFGDTFESVKRNLHALCPSTVFPQKSINTILLALYPIYRALVQSESELEENPSFLTVQAAPYDDESYYEKHLHNFPHYLSVGFFNLDDSNLSESGTSLLDDQDWSRYVNSAQGVGAGLYINWHAQNRRKPHPFRPMTADIFGIDFRPIFNVPSTSNTAPIAISWLIHRRQTGFAGRPFDTVATQLLKSLTPSQCPGLPGNRCLYQDPLKLNQFEYYRLELDNG